MATLKQKIAAERRVREMLQRDAVPPPDRIEYGHTCIRLLWNGPKVALVVDIDEFACDEANTLQHVDVRPRNDAAPNPRAPRCKEPDS